MSEKYAAKRTQTLALIGIFTAVITSLTFMIRIPSPSSGYINLGDSAIMLATLVLPFRGAVVAAGVGSALADIFAGYLIYAPFTFFIKILEVIVIYLLRRYLTTNKYFIPFFAGGLVMALSYAIVDGIMLMGIGAFFISLGGNIGQGVVSAMIVTVVYPKFNKMVTQLRGLDT